MMAQVQRAFVRLLIGKALTVVLGLTVLLLIWRRVSPEAYGQYLSLVATAEIVSLVSALGLSTVAQRHLPVWLAHATGPGEAFARVAQVLLGRTVLAGVFLCGLAWAAGSSGPIWSALSGVLESPLALALLILTVLARSLEEVQAALLMQTWVQGLAVAAHTMRLAALTTRTPVGTGAAAPFEWLVTLELAIACVVVTVGLVATALRAVSTGRTEEALRREPSSTWRQAWRTALEFWWIQCLGLLWSLHVLRLILHAWAGPLPVAVHAVAHSMVESLRQATPLVWLTGWLRAAMLRLHAGQPESGMALDLAAAVHRVSLLMLWPVVAAWCAEPTHWYRWAGGAQMFSKAQEIGQLHPSFPLLGAVLMATALLAPIQNRHLLISLWSYVQQRPRGGVWASLAAASLALPSLGLMWPHLGLLSLPLVMLMAELIWVCTASRGWTARVTGLHVRTARLAVPLAALLAAAMGSLVLDALDEQAPLWRLGVPLTMALLSVAVLARYPSVWTAPESQAVHQCLPAGLQAAQRRWMRGPFA